VLFPATLRRSEAHRRPVPYGSEAGLVSAHLSAIRWLRTGVRTGREPGAHRVFLFEFHSRYRAPAAHKNRQRTVKTPSKHGQPAAFLDLPVLCTETRVPLTSPEHGAASPYFAFSIRLSPSSSRRSSQSPLEPDLPRSFPSPGPVLLPDFTRAGYTEHGIFIRDYVGSNGIPRSCIFATWPSPPALHRG